MFDIAIVGYGPAGITAAIYAARKRLKVGLIGELPGGEITTSGEIENWPGDRQTNGIALSDKFVSHLKDHEEDVKVIQDKIKKVEKSEESFILARENGEPAAAKSVIYAAGRHPRELKVPGEKELKNRGVSYCATCDAPLFQGKNVAVVGGGNTGAEAVIMFQKIAKKTYFLHIDEKLAADKILVQNFADDPNVELLLNSRTTKILGDKFVTGLEYEDAITGETRKLDVDAVFVTIGAIPNTEPVKDLVSLDEYGAIMADRYGKTDVDGFFAAGDVTDIRDAQIVVAAGHGCSAALSAGDYLSRLGA